VGLLKICKPIENAAQTILLNSLKFYAIKIRYKSLK